MNKIFIIIAAMLIAGPALASSCYNIADADGRAYCLAKQRRDAGYCNNIQNATTRAMCMGEVRK